MLIVILYAIIFKGWIGRLIPSQAKPKRRKIQFTTSLIYAVYKEKVSLNSVASSESRNSIEVGILCQSSAHFKCGIFLSFNQRNIRSQIGWYSAVEIAEPLCILTFILILLSALFGYLKLKAESS